MSLSPTIWTYQKSLSPSLVNYWGYSDFIDRLKLLGGGQFSFINSPHDVLHELYRLFSFRGIGVSDFNLGEAIEIYEFSISQLPSGIYGANQFELVCTLHEGSLYQVDYRTQTFGVKTRNHAEIIHDLSPNLCYRPHSTYATNSASPKCECGSAIVGSDKHSHYCPLYRKDDK